MDKPVRLIDVGDESRFGGKALNLASALRAEIPVPDGFALSHEFVAAIAGDEAQALEQAKSAFSQMRAPIAVRSSAIGEDSAGASFAGQHSSILNVTDFTQMVGAIDGVVASAHTPSALAYRERLGIEGPPLMAIVLQELLAPECAGVLFTQNPLSGADERVIEAAWGLGEVVVSGLVVPDYYRLGTDGEILEKRIGDKDLMLRTLPEGGTAQVEVEPSRAQARILTDDDLKGLHLLAERCQSVYGKKLDLEWCRAEDKLYLLQCRSITTSGG